MTRQQLEAVIWEQAQAIAAPNTYRDRARAVRYILRCADAYAARSALRASEEERRRNQQSALATKADAETVLGSLPREREGLTAKRRAAALADAYAERKPA